MTQFSEAKKVPMTARRTIDVGSLIENHRIGWFQIRVLLATCAVMFIEGYDMQVMSYAAPAIIRDWRLSKAYFGPVFGFGLFGYLLGGTVLSFLGDRFGRKKVIIGGALLFGAFTLVTAYATSLTALLVLRFLAGIGLGASIPAAVALTVEYSSARLKNTTVSVLFLGYTIGGTVGGLIAAKLIPIFGWPIVFQIGGAAPILLALVIALVLPESVRFLVLVQNRPDRAIAILRKFTDVVSLEGSADLIATEEKHHGFPVKHLFTDGRATMTALLWLAFVMSLLGHYFLTSWLPTILTGAAIPFTYAVISTALLQGGGGIGGLLICWITDKKGILFIAAAFLLASPLITLIPFVGGSSLLTLSFLIGFFLLGGQIGLNSISGTVYPTDVRSTGVGWALGVGRVGSILGPVLGGILISLQLRTQLLFMFTSLVVLCCAFAVVLLWKVTTSFSLPISQATAAPHD